MHTCRMTLRPAGDFARKAQGRPARVQIGKGLLDSSVSAPVSVVLVCGVPGWISLRARDCERRKPVPLPMRNMVDSSPLVADVARPDDAASGRQYRRVAGVC